ncbi:hypothetical protein ABK046_45605, partial [Streptomyces caeruleatus]
MSLVTANASAYRSWHSMPRMQLDEGVDYYLKPMNCPMHNLIFDARGRMVVQVENPTSGDHRRRGEGHRQMDA